MTSKALSLKEKLINYFIKIKNYSMNDTIRQMKSHQLEEIFVKHVLIKPLNPKHRKNSKSPTISWANKQPKLKWAKYLNRYLTIKDVQIVNKHIKICSTLFVIRNLHINTIMKYHYNLLGWLKSKKTDNTNCLWVFRARETHSFLVWMKADKAILEKSLTVVYKTKHSLNI